MIYHHKKENMICLDVGTLRALFERPIREELSGIVWSKVLNGDISLSGLLDNQEELQKIAEEGSMIKDKEDVEIFLAGYMMQIFYDTEKVCFCANNSFSPERDEVDSIDDLKKHWKEDHYIDFGLVVEEGLIPFQVKGYRGKCNINELMDFLKKNLKKYGFDMSDINLHITLQGEGDIEGDFFHEIHEKLKDLPLEGKGEIMITYNEDNEFDVLNVVYPYLRTKREPHEPLSTRL